MNTNSPLVPQGSMPPKGKSTIKIAFFTIVAIHVVVIGGMLMQGCSKDKQSAQKVEDPNNAVPAISSTPAPDQAAPAVTPQDPTPAPATGTPATAQAPAVQVPVQPPVAVQAPVTPAATPAAIAAPATPAGETKEYAVAKGDTLGGIAKKNHISVKALQDANPGVNPTKLQINQKLQIPAAGTASATPATPAAAAGATDATADSSSYKVKSGDVLEKIAKNHGTSVKAIVALNNLKSRNSLKVGQVLKMPAPKSAAAPAASAAPSADATAPATTTVASAPATTSAQ